MIRHGADYGDRAVDGTSLYSEMTGSRNESLVLRKFFLRDGAYEWMHIIKLRGEFSLVTHKIPVRLFCEIGGVYSYFTDVEEDKLNAGSAGNYSRINTPQYPERLRFIGMLGVQIFPKY